MGKRFIVWLPLLVLPGLMLIALASLGQATKAETGIRKMPHDPFGMGFEDNCLDCHIQGYRELATYCHWELGDTDFPARSYISKQFLSEHFIWIATSVSLPKSLFLPAQTETAAQVNLLGLSLYPATVSVPVGATVTWTNLDIVTNTLAGVTNPDNGITPFGSIDMPPGASYSHTFNEPGIYNYQYLYRYSQYTAPRIEYNLGGTVIVGEQPKETRIIDGGEDPHGFVFEEAD